MIETAKANGLEPLEYIHTRLDELPRCKAEDSIEDLMPWVVAGLVGFDGRLQFLYNE
ncbi:MAG: transposase domain-containing protein [Marinagarivorans sp.]